MPGSLSHGTLFLYLKHAAAIAIGISFGASVASAADFDFADEVQVAHALPAREMGIELGSDSRVDRDYRLQGWFTPEAEVGLTNHWLAEGTASFVNRGRGIEFGAWTAESRYLLLEQPHFPFSLAAGAEYEVGTTAAKHLSLERAVAARAILSREFPRGILATLDWGWNRRLRPLVPAPSHRYSPIIAGGVRFPEGAPVSLGIEYRHETLEHLTQFGPELRIKLPNGSLLRLGGFAGRGSRLYRFIGRAILEADL